MVVRLLSAKGVALLNVASLISLFEPLNALLGTAMGK